MNCLNQRKNMENILLPKNKKVLKKMINKKIRSIKKSKINKRKVLIKIQKRKSKFYQKNRNKIKKMNKLKNKTKKFNCPKRNQNLRSKKQKITLIKIRMNCKKLVMKMIMTELINYKLKQIMN